MSSRTRAVAVAVKACRLTPGNRSRSRAELPVLRPEVVAPLADAVRLVDGDERTGAPPDATRRGSTSPPSPTSRSGDDVQQAEAALADAGHHAGLLRPTSSALL